MFWKKMKEKEPPSRIEQEKSPPAPVEIVESNLDKLMEATSKLAASLSSYSAAAYRASQSGPDTELLEAQAKVVAARKLITEGQLAYSLGRRLPDHMRHWPAWSQREDFQNWVDFNASEIVATSSEVADGSRKNKVVDINFTFNESGYRFILTDRGYSTGPDLSERIGEVELHFDGQCVAKFAINGDNYGEWKFSDVLALKVGAWMKDVIDMSTQIDATRRKRSTDFWNEITLNKAREIDLG